jgi:hypothetical protein
MSTKAALIIVISLALSILTIVPAQAVNDADDVETTGGTRDDLADQSG